MQSLSSMSRVDPTMGLFSLEGLKRFTISSVINGLAYQVISGLNVVAMDGNMLLDSVKLGAIYSGVNEATSATGFSYTGAPGPLMRGNIKGFLDNVAANGIGLLGLYQTGLDSYLQNVLGSVLSSLPMVIPAENIIVGVAVEVIRAVRDALLILIGAGALPPTARYLVQPASILMP